MTVPTAFADLSTTPATNVASIGGSDSVIVLDDHLRTVYAFIASVYANSGNGWSSPYLTAANPSYTGTLTGGTGVVNIGASQIYKDAAGNVGLGAAPPAGVKLYLSGTTGPSTDGMLSMPAANTAAQLRVVFNNSGNLLGIGADASGNFIVGTTAVPLGTSPTVLFTLTQAGNLITKPPATPPALTVNGDMVMNLTSDTNFRISARGSDGVTRVANITLA